MIKHFKYLRYLLRHKLFVFMAGRRIGVSTWRLIKHDWTKLLPSEWFPYVESFYGGPRTEQVKAAFNQAWLHHQHWNDHHWQHWVLREDSGALKVLKMPQECAFEMVADWAGAGRAITGRWEVASWYQKNSEKIQLHPETRALVEGLLDKSTLRKLRSHP